MIHPEGQLPTFPLHVRGVGQGLEACLLPLVRRALRRRTGLPALVGWVERAIAVLGTGVSSDDDRTARGLACILSELLQRQAMSRRSSQTETVCGP
jgi:hypothetical protein